jgi:hypothetical protein
MTKRTIPITVGSMWIRQFKRPEYVLLMLAAGAVVVGWRRGELAFQMVPNPQPLPEDEEDE